MSTSDIIRTPVPRRGFDAERDVGKITEWGKEYFARAGFTQAVLGLSGGIDSAVVYALAVKMLGEENVYAYALPYAPGGARQFRSSSKQSLDHFEAIRAMYPKGNFAVIDIAAQVDFAAQAVTGSVAARGESVEWTPLAAGNLMARTRAVTLRTLAAHHGALLLGTENQSEHMLGYFTLGGDDQSDLEPILNYYKTEVRLLARALPLPEEVRGQTPSADLWEGQTDEGELGFTYAQGDRVLERLRCGAGQGGWADGREFYETLEDLPRDQVQRVLDRVRASEFKRREKPAYNRNDR